MSRIVTSNSFTRSQVRLAVRLFAMLLEGRDVSVLIRSSEFSEICRKFGAMYKKWEEPEEESNDDPEPSEDVAL